MRIHRQKHERRGRGGGSYPAREIAADAHHAFVGDPPFEFENRPIRGERQRLQGRLFFGEGLIDDEK
jgi:hypothetical protein